MHTSLDNHPAFDNPRVIEAGLESWVGGRIQKIPRIGLTRRRVATLLHRRATDTFPVQVLEFSVSLTTLDRIHTDLLVSHLRCCQRANGLRAPRCIGVSKMD
jgi:hypothetical protein